jgi:hypothetical protein
VREQLQLVKVEVLRNQLLSTELARRGPAKLDALLCRRDLALRRPEGAGVCAGEGALSRDDLAFELGEGYADALHEHRRLLRAAFVAHGGVEVDT